MTPAEAVFGFAAWLTTRSESITVGATEDASLVVVLAERFIKANNLGEVSPSWPSALVHPNEV